MEVIFEDFNNFQSHSDGLEVFDKLKNILQAIEVSPVNNIDDYQKVFRQHLDSNGFSAEIKLHMNHKRKTITSIKKGVAISNSLGNIANGHSNLLKLNYYSTLRNNFAAIFICHINSVGNKTYFSRITSEIDDMYSAFIKFPIRIIGINQNVD